MMQGKPRLAILTNWYPSEENPYYGIFVKNQALLLSKKYEVHIVIFNNGLLPKQSIDSDGALVIHRRSEPTIPKRNVFLYKYWAKRYARFLKTLDVKYDFDVIHAHDYQPGIAAYYFNKLTGRNYFITLHNTAFLDHSIEAYKDPLIRTCLSYSQKVISVGKKLQESINLRYQLENSVIIPNHVDTDIFTISPTPRKATRFLLVGYLNNTKGTKKVIEAFISSDIVDSELYLVGANELESGYIEKISKENNDITYLGVVDHGKMPAIYQQCDCLISFSKVETFGITVIEAMACGLPVIYNESGGPEDLIPDYAGIKTEHDVASLSMAMSQYLINKKEYDASLIRENVVRKYGSESVRAELKNMYSES